MPYKKIKQIKLESHEDVYEQMFIQYLQMNCDENSELEEAGLIFPSLPNPYRQHLPDCASIYQQRIMTGCAGRKWYQDECNNGAKKALLVYCNSDKSDKVHYCNDYRTSTEATFNSTTADATTASTASSSNGLLIGALIGGALFFFCICIVVLMYCRRKKSGAKNDQEIGVGTPSTTTGKKGKKGKTTTSTGTTKTGTTKAETTTGTTGTKPKKAKKAKKTKKAKKAKKGTTTSSTGY